MNVLFFILGLILLIVGAELLVRGASRLAIAFGVTPLVVGLTVVALGTSSPEIAISSNAALTGQAGIVLGNVIGSNIFNVLAILGLSAIITPLIVSRQLIRLEVPLIIGYSVLILLFALDGQLGRFEGIFLLLSLIAYVTFTIRQSQQESEQLEAEYNDKFGRDEAQTGQILFNIGMAVVGLVLLVFGSNWLVDSAVFFAQLLGVSELIIGLTIISAGTSLPEVVTSVIAASRGARDIAVGNVVGSNIFNLMAVLGVASTVAPEGIPVSSAVIGFDLPVMIAVSLVCLPIFFTGGIISRREGLFLMGYYITYTLYLILAATEHDALPRFNFVMLYFVVPLTVAVLAYVVVQEFRRRQRRTGVAT